MGSRIGSGNLLLAVENADPDTQHSGGGFHRALAWSMELHLLPPERSFSPRSPAVSGRHTAHEGITRNKLLSKINRGVYANHWKSLDRQ
jgi:hypothetical protein